MKSTWKKVGIFAGGVLFGTAGVGILAGREAKKLYTYTTAAVLRAKESVMTKVTSVKENADDILADAKEMNEKRTSEACCETIEDCSCGCNE